MQDEPDAALIADAVAADCIVRTRADTDLVTDEQERQRALDSGAQIVSTDFYAPLVQEQTGYTVAFGRGALVRAAPR